MRAWSLLLGFLVLAGNLQAQYTAPYVALTGVLSSSNGMPAQNYAITFQPTQLFFVAGTSVIITGSTCATDVTGQVVGIRNPLGPPIVSVLGGGVLPASNYYVAITWYDTYGNETLLTPVAAAQLTSAGGLSIVPPTAGAPLNAIGMNVYIGTSPTALTYQGQTTTTVATYVQSQALNSGQPSPISNTTVCQVVANDAGWPTGTGYNVTISNGAGQTMPGYPQQWQFLNAGSTYNLSNGLPIYNGRVTFPVPILATPYNHNLQSISGPLSMGVPGGIGYNIVNVNLLGVGTYLPAWGVDVEGAGLAGIVNAKGGYLVNGAGGTTGHCLGSDGTAYDTDIPCLTSIGNIYYQTVEANGTSQTQRVALNFSSNFAVTDSSSPLRTNVDLAMVGTAGSCTACNETIDAYGRVTVHTNSGLGVFAFNSFSGCTFPDDGANESCTNTVTIAAMPDTSYSVICTEYTTGLSTAVLGTITYAVVSSTSYTVTETTQGSSSEWSGHHNYGKNYVCQAHHT